MILKEKLHLYGKVSFHDLNTDISSFSRVVVKGKPSGLVFCLRLFVLIIVYISVIFRGTLNDLNLTLKKKTLVLFIHLIRTPLLLPFWVVCCCKDFFYIFTKNYLVINQNLLFRPFILRL